MSDSAKKCPPSKGRASPILCCNLRDFPDKVIHDPDFLHLLAVHLFDLANQNPADEPVQHRFGQFLIAGDPMFGQEVQRFRRPLQILDGRPMLVAGALPGFDILSILRSETKVLAFAFCTPGKNGAGTPGTGMV